MRYILDVEPSDREPGRLRVQLTAGSGSPLVVDTLDAAEIPAAVEAALREHLEAIAIVMPAPDVPPDPGDELPGDGAR